MYYGMQPWYPFEVVTGIVEEGMLCTMALG